ncbi:MAG: cell surface protein SprA, partial [candidate division Zixibacteria bacterium]|nr:cell surface protein SprA [candidate division Zixibacteria bacterium]
MEYTDLGVRRATWTLSSAPIGRNLKQRGRMIWYNPYDRYLIKDIWPSIETTTENDRINILVLKLDADSPHIPADTSFVPNIDVWNGVMRALPLGSADQSKTEFLEIWVNGDKGKIHIDLGRLSEDIDGNGILDTEDSTRNAMKDGILQDDENKGLDHMWDAEESTEYFAKTGISLHDPSGDDWYYNDEPNKRNDYSHINGTEGNADDQDRGRHPDTENLDRNDVLDVSNSYFEFNIDLVSDAPVEVSGQNWKLYRIPLKGEGNYDTVGTPDWSDIRFARVWIEDCDSINPISIASLQLVGNRWRSSGTSPIGPGSSPAGDSSSFRVFVINTHENPEYSSPPGVAGEEDKSTGVRQKEQSLVLKYENLKPGYYGAAYRTLYQVEDYTNYKDIKMYVHGPAIHTPSDTAGLKFFFRIGSDSVNYYEYHTDLDSGWNERNYVLINFEEITGIKSHMLQEPSDSGGYDVTQGHYRIRGEPTLSQVKWFSMGVENDTLSTQVKSGEVWVDELRVADVRKNPGWAIRSSVSANFADLLSISLSLNKTDSEFHNLVTNRGSGVNSTGTSFGTSINLEKFIPPSWGLKLPFSYSWSKNLAVPRLKVGSDIVLPAEQRDQEKTESVNESFSFSPSFKKNTKNWITNWTLNRISTGMSYSKQKGRSPATPVSNSSNYQVTGGYDLTPPSKLSFSPLTWSKKVFLLNKLSQTKFYYLPTALNFDGKVYRVKSYSLNDFGSPTSVYTRDFDGGMNLAFSPFGNLPLSYTWRTNRDIRDDSRIKFSLNPSKMRLGIERTNRKSFNASYSPKIFSFLDHRFSFNSNYNENCDPLQFRDGTRSVTNDNTKSASFTLRWQKLLEKVSLEDKPKSASADKKETKSGPLSWIRKKIGFLSKRINPLQGSVSRNKSFTRSGLLDRPSFRYQLGFTDDPDVGMKPTTSGTINDALTTRDNYSLRSGIAILGTNLDISYSETITDTRNPNAHTENRSKTFPELSFGWNNINKFKFLNKYVSSLGFRFGYSRKVGTT